MENEILEFITSQRYILAYKVECAVRQLVVFILPAPFPLMGSPPRISFFTTLKRAAFVEALGWSPPPGGWG